MLKSELHSVSNDETCEFLTNNINTQAKENMEKVPPDGGWGWLIVFGSFIIITLCHFPGSAFSILFLPILKSHGISSSRTAWIFNLNRLTFSVYMLFMGPLCDEFGFRKIALLGGITVFLSMILSAFAPSPDFLFLSYGLLGGIGGSSNGFLALLIMSKYFKKRLGLATGISLCGFCANSFLAPIVSNYLLQNYGYKGASLICAAIVLNQCVGAMFYEPVERHMKSLKSNRRINRILKEENIADYRNTEETNLNSAQSIILAGDNKMDVSSSYTTYTESTTLKQFSQAQRKEYKINTKNNPKSIKVMDTFIRVLKSAYSNFKSMKYFRVQIIAWAYCGHILGFYNFQMWVPFTITDAGYSLETAAWCISLTSIGDLSGRFVTTLMSDRRFFNVRYGYMLGLFLIGFSIIGFSFASDIKVYLIFGCIWGFGAGISFVLLVPVIVHVVGVEMLPAVIGCTQLLQGIVGLVIGTLTGAVRDATLDFTYISWILGGVVLACFCLWLLMPCAEWFDKKMYGKEEKSQASENS